MSSIMCDLVDIVASQDLTVRTGLKGYTIDACVSSDLARAHHTAKIICKGLGGDLVVATDPGLQASHCVVHGSRTLS